LRRAQLKSSVSTKREISLTACWGNLYPPSTQGLEAGEILAKLLFVDKTPKILVKAHFVLKPNVQMTLKSLS